MLDPIIVALQQISLPPLRFFRVQAIGITLLIGVAAQGGQCAKPLAHCVRTRWRYEYDRFSGVPLLMPRRSVRARCFELQLLCSRRLASPHCEPATVNELRLSTQQEPLLRQGIGSRASCGTIFAGFFPAAAESLVSNDMITELASQVCSVTLSRNPFPPWPNPDLR
jgi:hypothetical protein